MFRKWTALMLALLLCLGCAACSAGGEKENTPPSGGSIDVPDQSEMFSDRDFDGSYSNYVTVTLADGATSVDGQGVRVDGETVTITAAGTYLLQGSLSDGQIIVSVSDTQKVQLVLAGVNITNDTSAAIYIKEADKVFLTLAADTENILSVTGEFVQTDDNNVDGVIFTKSDMTINGDGTLLLKSAYGHGVEAKDDLKITAGTIGVEAAKKGLSGKDSVRIAGGSIAIVSGTDGIQSKNDEDSTRGYLYIAGGSIRIQAGTDGMDASTDVTILGGTFDIKTGGGSENATQSGSGMFWPGWGGNGSGSSTEESMKGIKAAGELTIVGGTFAMDTQDDAIHSNDRVQIADGTFTVAAGDDGIHADNELTVLGGTITVTGSYEGLEANVLTICGGNIDLTASDDGLNAAGGNDGSGMGGPWGGGDQFGSSSSAAITISGGTLLVNAGGDGLDSNGKLTISGGEVYVDGPTNSGNGAIDSAQYPTASGGTLVALGASGMAMGFGEDTKQGGILYNLPGAFQAGTLVSLTDSKGNVLVSYTSRKAFNSVALTTPGIQKGGKYTLTVGQQSYEITMSANSYANGGMNGGMNGGRPGGGGGRPGGRP